MKIKIITIYGYYDSDIDGISTNIDDNFEWLDINETKYLELVDAVNFLNKKEQEKSRYSNTTRYAILVYNEKIPITIEKIISDFRQYKLEEEKRLQKNKLAQQKRAETIKKKKEERDRLTFEKLKEKFEH